jgi:hypothetical protein
MPGAYKLLVFTYDHPWLADEPVAANLYAVATGASGTPQQEGCILTISKPKDRIQKVSNSSNISKGEGNGHSS